MMPTPDTKPRRGERREIDHTECVFTGERWARARDLEKRLSDLVALEQYNTRMGAPWLAKVNREEIAHIRELMAGVDA